MTVVVKNLMYKNECYVIAEKDGWYVPINKRYINKQGKLTKNIYGGHKTINEAIQCIKDQVDVKELIDNGMDETEAIVKICLRK